MATLTQIAKQKPSRVVVLPVHAFAETWSERPAAPVAVGLRRLSERDIQTAKSEASREVDQAYSRDDGTRVDAEKAVEAWNDALVRWAVAYAACDANNVDVPYFPFAEDTLARALTPEGIQRLYDELVLLHDETNPRVREADLEFDAAGMSVALQKRVRRLAGAIAMLVEESK